MQADMHYYGTWAMAVAAGLSPDAATTVATAAQYVDDNTGQSQVTFADGTVYPLSPTAHHTTNFDNLDPDDQRRTWVPFHFLPGGLGGPAGEQRLVCVKDGDNAARLLDAALGRATADGGLEVMGVTAHVYADTFSHHGFIGIASDLNRVAENSIEIGTDGNLPDDVRGYIEEKAERFKADAANLVEVGHGGVATYPDRPYLAWRFRYAQGDTPVERVNRDDFLAGCRALHALFGRFRALRPDLGGGTPAAWNDIANAVAAVLAVAGSMEVRIAAWQSSVDTITAGAATAIPVYDAAALQTQVDGLAAQTLPAFQQSFLGRFHAAAHAHREFVLDTLLGGTVV